MSYHVLVTGAKGFVGKNFVCALNAVKNGTDKVHTWAGCDDASTLEILEYDIDSTADQLDAYCAKADFVFNFAGVNRPQNNAEFMQGNFGFGETLLRTLEKHGNTCPVMLSSSIQASLEGRYAGSEYGKSKLAGEQLFTEYGKRTGARVLVYRFANLFGKWCRPNYNSAVATFCHNIAHDLPIQVNDRSVCLDLVYIDDLMEEMFLALDGKEHRDASDFCTIPTVHHVTLGEVADLIESFKKSRADKSVPDMTENSFSKKLYATYLSYLPSDEFSYPLKMNVDARGSFTEILRTVDRGQFSVNVSKPGITKGQHWHHTKNEKFVVVHGTGLIQLRNLGTDEIVDYYVNGEEITVVDMIPGYTHNIINLSETEDLVTFMWCNECFNPEKPDTFYEEV